jgi:hypothetical protein
MPRVSKRPTTGASSRDDAAIAHLSVSLDTQAGVRHCARLSPNNQFWNQIAVRVFVYCTASSIRVNPALSNGGLTAVNLVESTPSAGEWSGTALAMTVGFFCLRSRHRGISATVFLGMVR